MYSLKKIRGHSMRKIITLSTMIILLAGAIFTSPFLALPSNGDSVIWNASIFVSETNELSDSVEFGEASDAIDGPPVDSYDTLKPPAPMVPYLRMYFTDNLPSPYDVLWSDFRQYPGSMKIWNLSIQWVPRDYSSSTLVTISWNPDELLISEYDHITLNSETGTLLQDMLLNDNYSFNCPAMVPQNFKVICTRTNFPPVPPSTPDGETSGYHGSSYLYATSSTDPDGDDLYYQFDWGASYLSGWLGPYLSGEQIQASFSWDSPGNYGVKVHVKDIYGSQSEWSTSLEVEMMNRAPLTPSNPVPQHQASNIQITPTLSWTNGDPDGDLVSFDVYFGSSTPPMKVVSNQSSLSFTPGVLAYKTTYQWRIVAWDVFGGQSNSTVWSFTTKSSDGGSSTEPPDGNQNQTNQQPTANASLSEQTGVVGRMLYFNGSGSYDSDGYLTSWVWDFGDGMNGTGERTTHIYQSIGVYEVTLTVTDDDGATSTDTINVEIGMANQPPTQPIISGTRTGQRNTAYEYRISSTDPENDFLQYTVRWGDGSSNTSAVVPNGTQCSFSHSWVHSGKYTLVATATDNMSLSEEATQEVFIDVVFVKSLGFLFDANDDGIPDSFFINNSEKITEAHRLENGRYLLDTTGDGTWGYVFNPQTGVLSAIETGFTTIEEPWVFAIMIVVGVCIIAGIVYLYKKNYF